jgi:hypothetical protein
MPIFDYQEAEEIEHGWCVSIDGQLVGSPITKGVAQVLVEWLASGGFRELSGFVQHTEDLEMTKRREEDPQFTVLSTLFQMGHIVLTRVGNVLVTYDHHGLHFYNCSSFDGPLYFLHHIAADTTMSSVDLQIQQLQHLALSYIKKERPYGM